MKEQKDNKRFTLAYSPPPALHLTSFDSVPLHSALTLKTPQKYLKKTYLVLAASAKLALFWVNSKRPDFAIKVTLNKGKVRGHVAILCNLIDVSTSRGNKDSLEIRLQADTAKSWIQAVVPFRVLQVYLGDNIVLQSSLSDDKLLYLSVVSCSDQNVRPRMHRIYRTRMAVFAGDGTDKVKRSRLLVELCVISHRGPLLCKFGSPTFFLASRLSINLPAYPSSPIHNLSLELTHRKAIYVSIDRTNNGFSIRELYTGHGLERRLLVISIYSH